MPPILEAMLEELPEHHLRRTVAERWGLKVATIDDRDELLQTMLDAMRSPARVREVVDRLYGDLRRVVYHLVLRDGTSTTEQVAEQVFQGDLWRTKQSLEELRNHQLVHLARVGEVQGSYPEYRARVPKDLLDPLRQALGLVPQDPASLPVADPEPVHRAGYDGLRDAVAILVRARRGDVERTREGDLKQRTRRRLADVVTDDDPDRLDLLVGAVQDLGLTGSSRFADAFLRSDPARAQVLLVAGALDRSVPGTTTPVEDLLWVVPALAELPDGWLDTEAALAQLRLEGLRRDFQRWFGRTLDDAAAFVRTAARWLGLVDLAGEDGSAIRLSPVARALLGLDPPPGAEPPRVVVDANLEVHLFQDPPEPGLLDRFHRFARPVHLGPASRFELTKDTVWEGLSGDLGADDVLDALGDDVPSNVASTVRRWARQLHRVDLDRAWVLTVADPDLLDDLLDTPEVAPHIDRVGPRHARVDDPRRVGSFLEEAGLAADVPDVRPGGRGRDPAGEAPPFETRLRRLSKALGVGLPAWTGGPDADLDRYYEPA